MTHPEKKKSPERSKALSFPQRAMQKLGLKRDIDCALHLPFRYENETQITPLKDVKLGTEAQIEVSVTHCEIKNRQLLIWVRDNTESCLLRFFHFYPSQQKTLALGNKIRARGVVKSSHEGLIMLHPHFKIAQGTLPDKLTPIYPTTTGLSQKYLSKVISTALNRLELPEIFNGEQLSQLGALEQTKWPLKEALQFLHHPPPNAHISTLENRAHPAWQRLKVDELLAHQLSQLVHKRRRHLLQAPSKKIPDNVSHYYREFEQHLPFTLTTAQQRVIAEISADLTKTSPMHRLLQGDVGAGKTIVAAIITCLAIDFSWQCALMAPTEILVEQHLHKLVQWLEPLGIEVAWLTGSQSAKERRTMLEKIKTGQAQIVVGTHALIQKKVEFHHLGLVIIDEQHRFGVSQRLALRQKTKEENVEPHLLMMTATPIPRTLAMSYYTDLDISTIDELPPGRNPILTKAINNKRRKEVIARISDQLSQGRQTYWVCPLIEESELLDLRNATQTYEELSQELTTLCTDQSMAPKVGLLHSRMIPEQKKRIMGDFASGKIALLVSTTVIEVGVDVPNASLMVIEHAERFGLSQLHQLRGRVGRGKEASACVLLYSLGENGRLSEASAKRIGAMVQTQDGFEISRQDLEIRGPGEMLGARQSGTELMRFSNLIEDDLLVTWAKNLAPHLLDNYPKEAHQHIERWLGNKSEYLLA